MQNETYFLINYGWIFKWILDPDSTWVFLPLKSLDKSDKPLKYFVAC